ncbi:MAG: HAD hydrolase family protein [Bacteroidia bacterium]|nr:HAD hydrolase family protein [Bacteroidia bacterium]
MKANYKTLLPAIKAFVFDVDGVFTDGTVQITTTGELLRTMSIKDGYAVKQAVEAGYKICVITGGTNQGVEKRLAGLGVTDIHLGVHDKIKILDAFMIENDLKAESIAYMGDDLPDIEAMQKAGVASCPNNAVAEIKAISDYVSHKNGGDGCVRDIIEQVMRVQDQWIKGIL